MSTVEELKAQREALDRRIKEAEQAEQSGAIKQIVEICRAHKISYAQLKPHMTKQRKPRKRREADPNGAES